jgi:methyl-accepting chemotaxis protein
MFKRAQKPSFDAQCVLDAFSRSQAIIEFKPDGKILTANENFLGAIGYSLSEIAGRHHSMFMAPESAASPEYRAFWAQLAAGSPQAGEFARVAKGGRTVWIQATYNPVRDTSGAVAKVVKIAADITQAKLASLASAGQLQAIDRAQAVIEFDLDGRIVSANANFLAALGYGLEDILGKHHSLFVDPKERDGADYRRFWDDLRRGSFQSGEFRRITRSGEEIWIQATYNPIMGLDGKPMKVVKFASDITAQKRASMESASKIAAISKSMAVIEFDMSGCILDANENFLAATGYGRLEIVGRHHSMFCEPDYAGSSAYRSFWDALNRGEFQASEYRRVGKGGRTITIQASYNPIFDHAGKPTKVVKFASDITRQAQARQNVQTMISSTAAGMEQLSASVVEIAQNMTLSKQAADDAVRNVSTASDVVGRLTIAAQAMADITNLITDITGSINLLALNATIESARAGEAGRGFAVVASEVKNLAGQARAATERISSEIDSIQIVAATVHQSFEQIRGSIEGVNQFVVSTSAAVEEQSVVTGGIAASMQDAAMEAEQLIQAA